MLLMIFTLTVAIAGLAAIEFAQPRRPREHAVWNDDVERRLLRQHSGLRERW